MESAFHPIRTILNRRSCQAKGWIFTGGNNTPPSTPPARSKPGDVCQACPGQLIVTVIEPDGTPVATALVKADKLQKLTDKTGKADFGMVDAKTYEISANKEGYSPWSVSGNLAQPDSDTVTVASQGLTTAQLGLQSCIIHRLAGQPIMIAMAAEDLTEPTQNIEIAGSVAQGLSLKFGQDSTTNLAESWPRDPNDLKADMYKLLDFFAADDKAGMAKRLFDAFLARQ